MAPMPEFYDGLPAIADNSFPFSLRGEVQKTGLSLLTSMYEQLKIFPTHACALTGHRTVGRDLSKEKLNHLLRMLIVDKNVDTFYCGMAMGFDLLACEMLLDLQKIYPQVKVVACIPCPGQSDLFPEREKIRYRELLKRCNSNVLISLSYTKFCMHMRNRYMVDNADYLLAYCHKPTGGSAGTVKYAQQKGIPVYFV